MSSETDTEVTVSNLPSAEAQRSLTPSDSGVSGSHWLQWFREGLRAAVLRPIRTVPDGPSVWQMLLIGGFIDVVKTALTRFQIDGPAHFSFAMWLWGWAPVGLMICGTWVILNMRPGASTHKSPTAAWLLLSSIAFLPAGLIGTAINAWLTSAEMRPSWVQTTMVSWAIYIVFVGWYTAAAGRVASAVGRSRGVTVAMMCWMLTVIGLQAFFLNTTAWQADYSREDEKEPEILTLSQEVFEKQQTLLNEALSAVKPHEGAQREVFGLIYAPYSQDVFLKESEMVQDVLEQQFDAKGRIVRLVNHPLTIDEIPWATNLNLERSVKRLAAAMDVERDVLVLYFTSHGGADFALATQHWPLEVEKLTAAHLREILDDAGVKHRVIAVSACYSGGWVEPLQNDNTLIMTAADKDHTSYGCGSKSELTFFGRAVFDEQLRKTHSFEEAFKAAVPIIKQREIEVEKSGGFSNPQISVGKDIQLVLREWERPSAQ